MTNPDTETPVDEQHSDREAPTGIPAKNKRKIDDEAVITPKKQQLQDASSSPAERNEIIEGEDQEEDAKIQAFPSELTISLEDIGTVKDIPDLSMKVNKYIKHILQNWESTSPKDEILLDTKKSLFPILVKLRKATVDVDQLTSLLTIFYYVQRTNYLKANESYMKLSIGNVAWPIGVINVSIHQRSGQVKLNKGGANIMIDEQTRKWITSIKRLITHEENRNKN